MDFKKRGWIEGPLTYYDTKLVESMEIIRIFEEKIEPTDDVVMFTWSPDPKELPDADPETQHLWCARVLLTYLNTMPKSCACLEYNLSGNPHYHGWYVKSDESVASIQILKVLQRYGKYKADYLRSIKINSYTSKGNGLYYYKKEVSHNCIITASIIYPGMELPKIPWAEYNQLFFTQNAYGKKCRSSYDEKISDMAYYMEFYKSSIYK